MTVFAVLKTSLSTYWTNVI